MCGAHWVTSLFTQLSASEKCRQGLRAADPEGVLFLLQLQYYLGHSRSVNVCWMSKWPHGNLKYHSANPNIISYLDQHDQGVTSTHEVCLTPGPWIFWTLQVVLWSNHPHWVDWGRWVRGGDSFKAVTQLGLELGPLECSVLPSSWQPSLCVSLPLWLQQKAKKLKIKHFSPFFFTVNFDLQASLKLNVKDFVYSELKDNRE